MKGLFSAGCVALIFCVLGFVGRSWSEPQKLPAPRTRIAVVNTGYVIKYYKLVEQFTSEMKDKFAEYQKTDAELKKEIAALEKQASNKDLPEAEQEEAQAKAKKLSRQLEDNSAQMKKEMNKRGDEQTVSVYIALDKVVARYAKDHDLDLVMTYIDAVKEADRYVPTNVVGKIQQRACVPLYVGSGIDISEEITAILNKEWLQSKNPKPAKEE